MSQSFVWPLFVVLFQPRFSLLTNFFKALKHEHVEHRFAVAAIEPLDEGILIGLAGLDVADRDAAGSTPYKVLCDPV